MITLFGFAFLNDTLNIFSSIEFFFRASMPNNCHALLMALVDFKVINRNDFTAFFSKLSDSFISNLKMIFP